MERYEVRYDSPRECYFSSCLSFIYHVEEVAASICKINEREQQDRRDTQSSMNNMKSGATVTTMIHLLNSRFFANVDLIAPYRDVH